MLATALIAAGAGLAAGALHVVTGPDHLAAIAPLAARSRTAAWRAGLRWGAGHAAGVMLVGTLALLLREVVDIEAVSGWGERAVGVLLIGIGLWAGRTALSRRLHLHPHRHGDHVHLHAHAHDRAGAHGPRPLRIDLARAAPASIPRTSVSAVARADDPGHGHGHAALGVGILHGLAGTSHLLGVLPALALPATEGAVYLLAFCAGGIAAMAGFAAALGGLAALCARHALAVYRGFLLTNAAAALAVGVWWLVGTPP